VSSRMSEPRLLEPLRRFPIPGCFPSPDVLGALANYGFQNFGAMVFRNAAIENPNEQICCVESKFCLTRPDQLELNSRVSKYVNVNGFWG
jgi:hypothetical protein